MNILSEFECNLLELKSFATRLAFKTNVGDIFLLNGDLGVGKTTFARFFINSLYKKHQINKPEKIKSPSFPILINYPLLNYEINHYDLYRIKNEKELFEMGFFENLENNISIIEWPKIILNNLNLHSYFLINLEFINFNKRKVKLYHLNYNAS